MFEYLSFSFNQPKNISILNCHDSFILNQINNFWKSRYFKNYEKFKMVFNIISFKSLSIKFFSTLNWILENFDSYGTLDKGYYSSMIFFHLL